MNLTKRIKNFCALLLALILGIFVLTVSPVGRISAVHEYLIGKYYRFVELDGEAVIQRIVPQYNYLKKVEIFIANIDSEAQGKIELILKNSKGKEIFHKKVKASDVPAGEFFSYSVNRRIQPGERYELYISYTGEKGVSGFPQLMVSERSHNLIETEEMLMDGQVSMEYNVAITYHYAQINPFRL